MINGSRGKDAEQRLLQFTDGVAATCRGIEPLNSMIVDDIQDAAGIDGNPCPVQKFERTVRNRATNLFRAKGPRDPSKGSRSRDQISARVVFLDLTGAGERHEDVIIGTTVGHAARVIHVRRNGDGFGEAIITASVNGIGEFGKSVPFVVCFRRVRHWLCRQPIMFRWLANSTGWQCPVEH